MFQAEVVTRLSGWAFWIDGNKDTPCTRAHAHENAINRTYSSQRAEFLRQRRQGRRRKKNPNEGSHDAGAGGRKQNPQHDFLANARSSCASAAEGGGEKKFQTEVVKMLVLVAVLN